MGAVVDDGDGIPFKTAKHLDEVWIKCRFASGMNGYLDFREGFLVIF